MFIIEALWFFLPAFVANQLPGLAAKFNLPGNMPVSVRWLGTNKTWAAYYTAGLAGVVTIYLQRQFPIPHVQILVDYHRHELWLVGLLFGLGAVLGDHIESFFKRRMGIKPGESWWPFDQLDYVAGSLISTAPLVEWIGWLRLTAIFVTVLLLAWPVNYIGYKLKIRKVIM